MGLVRVFILPNLDIIARAIILVFYPLYRTVKAIESPSVSDDQQWLTYWIINYCLIFIELSFQRVFSWLFFWPLLKLIVTTWLVVPQYNGAAYIYEYLVRQRILKVGGEGEEREASIGERKLDERREKGQKACMKESKLDKGVGEEGQKAYIGKSKLDVRGEEGQKAYIGERKLDIRGEGQKAYIGERKSDEKGEEAKKTYIGERNSDEKGEEAQKAYIDERKSDEKGEEGQKAYIGERKSYEKGEEAQKAYIGERKSDEKGEEAQKAYIGERKLDEKEEEIQKPYKGESKLDEKEGKTESSIHDGKIERRDPSKALDESENQRAYKDAVTDRELDTKPSPVVPKESTLPEMQQLSSPIEKQSETTPIAKITRKPTTRRWIFKDRVEKPNP